MRVGVLGGTYDPVHIGHLLVAEQAREALGLDFVLLVPAGLPPHKIDWVLTPYDLRLRMVEAALDGIPHLIASDLERETGSPSYTVETLRSLRAVRNDLEEVWLVMGQDSLDDLANWREPEEVVRLARLAVYPRPPGGGVEEGSGAVKGESGSVGSADSVTAWRSFDPSAWGGNVDRLDGPRIRLSSTEIRERVRDNRSIRFLVPDVVREFILREKLYRGPVSGARPAENRP